MEGRDANSEFRISCKDLGALALPDFCPRCFWVQRRFKIPYQIFPGIFSSIDAYTKSAVHNYVNKAGRLPFWGNAVGSIDEIVGIGRSGFNYYDAHAGVLLTGVPDDIFRLHEGGYTILDYKTARYTAGQDQLIPMYEVQLNGYRFLAEHNGMKPVKSLFLVYFEPPDTKVRQAVAADDTGFSMGFTASMHRVDGKINIGALLDKAQKIYLGKMPVGRDECENCKKLGALLGGLS